VSASTGVMNSLLGKLTTLMGQEYTKLKGLRKEVKFITDELSCMNDLLERLADVEQLDPQTRGWRNQVRDMAYDIEDIIDDFMHHDTRNQSANNDGFIRKTIRRLKTLRAKHHIAGQIQEIKNLVHETSERRTRYRLDECILASSHVAIDQRVVALYANSAGLVGLEGPMNALVNLVADEEQLLKVVSIVGFGGLGKTTLAKELYTKLSRKFQSQAFVSVSQKPDITKLLCSLLSQLGGQQPSHKYELHDLINIIRGRLEHKRYFIIIDDIWDVSAWDVIKCALPENNNGSRVIATTRIQKVANECCSNCCQYVFNMKPLGDNDSRRLFFSRTFGSEEASHQRHKELSVDILKKCSGLPLAIISIASLLASEGNNMKSWEHIHKSLCSMSGAGLNLEGMRQILNLSYSNLPRHLKTCLLYLCMYPEDYTIRKSKLIRRWIAEGFIGETNGQDVWEVASSYFNDLVNRSLVEPFYIHNDGSVRSCKVHDMMLDLILCKSEEENFVTAVNNQAGIAGLCEKARRLSLCSFGPDYDIILPGDISLSPTNISLSQLRSLAIRQEVKYMPLLSEFKFLRVLEASIYPSGALKDRKVDLTGLCKLHLLRYLKIRGCSWCELPTQIRGLQHLETFDIDGDSIPSDIVHLPCLSYLRAGRRVGGLPDGISNMKSLRYLWEFDLANNSTGNIKGLGEMTNLRYLKTTNGLSSTCESVLFSSLGKLCHLKHLHVGYDYGFHSFSGLITLSPFLETLHLTSWWFSRVPNWMQGLHNLCKLSLGVQNLFMDDFAILGELPALSDLCLCFRHPEEMVLIHPAAFPVLMSLTLVCSRSSYAYLTFLDGAMPRLERLYLRVWDRWMEGRPDLIACRDRALDIAQRDHGGG